MLRPLLGGSRPRPSDTVSHPRIDRVHSPTNPSSSPRRGGIYRAVHRQRPCHHLSHPHPPADRRGRTSPPLTERTDYTTTSWRSEDVLTLTCATFTMGFMTNQTLQQQAPPTAQARRRTWRARSPTRPAAGRPLAVAGLRKSFGDKVVAGRHRPASPRDESSRCSGDEVTGMWGEMGNEEVERRGKREKGDRKRERKKKKKKVKRRERIPQTYQPKVHIQNHLTSVV